MNAAVAENPSETAREFSGKAVTSPRNPAEKDAPSAIPCKYREQECCIFTVDHWDFTGPLLGFQCREAYLHFELLLFPPPGEFQSTCSTYPRWKTPVLCYSCTAPQNPLKSLGLEDKNLAGGEGNQVP